MITKHIYRHRRRRSLGRDKRWQLWQQWPPIRNLDTAVFRRQRRWVQSYYHLYTLSLRTLISTKNAAIDLFIDSIVVET